MKKKIKKKKRKKITIKQVLKWILIGLACVVLTIGIIARVHHYFSVHVK